MKRLILILVASSLFASCFIMPPAQQGDRGRQESRGGGGGQDRGPGR